MRPFLLSCLLASAATAFAQTTTPAGTSTADPAPADNSETIALDPLVVIDTLDRAREDIVPSLGASSYDLNIGQITALPQGEDAPFSQVLVRVPGVAQDADNQIHLRGEHANLQYRINDVLLPEGLSGFGQELDPRLVDTMQVLTGALPAQYGYRTSGVIDIHTKHGASAGDSLSLYGGAHDTFRPSFEASGSRGGVDAYASGTFDSSSRGIDNPAAAPSAIHDHSQQARGFAYASLVLDPGSRLNLIVSGSAARFEIPNLPNQPAQFALRDVPAFDSAALDESQRETNGYAVAAYQHTGDSSSFQAVVFARTSALHFNPDPIGDLVLTGVASDVRRDVRTFGSEIDARWSLSAAHTLRAGLIATTDAATTDTSTAVFPADENGGQTSDVPLTISQHQRKNGRIYGLYAQDEWAVSDRLTVNFGGRADGVSAYRTEGQLSPRLNLVYTVDPHTTLHAGYARYFTPPPLELLQTSDVALFAHTTNAPATTLSSPVRSERSHYFDVGAHHAFTDALSVNLDSYVKIARDQLDEGQFGRALIYSPFNFDRGRVDGAELSVNYSRHQLTAYANLAVSRATGRQIVSGEFQFDPAELAYIASHAVHLDHDQTYTASTGVSYTWRHTLMYADLTYGSGLRRGFANTEHLPAYSPLNLGLEHTWSLARHRKLKLRFDVVNALDQVYELRDGSGIGVGAPQFGERRSLYGGLSFTF